MQTADNQISNLLVENGLLKDRDLQEIMLVAKNAGISFYDVIIDKNIVTDETLGQMVAASTGYPFVILSKTAIPDELFHVTPEKVARRLKVIAFARDQTSIKLAMVNPNNKAVIAAFAKKTKANIIPYFATEKDIHNALRMFRKDLQVVCDNLLKDEINKSNTLTSDEAPITKIVDLMVNYAYDDKASDIHIEPEEKNSLIRFRIDGLLHDVLRVPKILHDRIIARIKVLSRLRTDEHLSAQDGKMKIKLQEENLDIRVSILPVTDGEKVVLRLLPSKSSQFTLTNLGLSDRDLVKVNKAIGKSYGMVLSTGPTGSGKTTIIYTILKLINIRERNITTIEDPVEYRIAGANQIQVNPKTNLTFAAGLRSILRQDPNIIFVGEIRDNETAGIAVDAALTGHLVLTTLHTNDAATAIPRLIDMKVEPFLVASTVNLIIAQRLVRKICEMCKTPINIPLSTLSQYFPLPMIKNNLGEQPQYTVFKGKGCKICRNTGYSGRVGLFEVLEVSNEIKKLITGKNDAETITRQAVKEGMKTMTEDGLDKIARGVTSLEEVIRVTKVESS
ncbi:hypothetical protein A2W14_03345 [Candidatus Gottesmanbacteria bacterium RBG_16_37_8]|uniref:AAA+ ATPase domain-containing protein n=1 Tax=Candidatus Gottesmanbacteria bacterium RBG_16_37_8 TaxID=1798371 RepID=A0A1F5YU21_9BACT|nr:MAG: hypothetical protein A2W14_03345 [Candidatus Gottesmanbacteria bacterium RBG_16_37_8]